MIQAHNLTKRYRPGDAPAVDSITCSIPTGTICGLLGRNGAGKSTTMGLLTGALVPSSGTVTIGGVSMKTHPIEAKKNLGYAPENPPLYPDMTPREFITFVARAKRVGDIPAEVERVLSLTGMKQREHDIIRTLSKGYRQRLGIAQALIGDPPALFLDEPSIGLDPKQSSDLRALIKTLGKSRTILLSSHILSEIKLLCDRILIISGGKIVADDTEAGLLSAYQSRDLEEVFLALTQDSGEEVSA